MEKGKEEEGGGEGQGGGGRRRRRRRAGKRREEEEEKVGKEPVATLSKHRDVREKVDLLYRQDAKSMKLKYAKSKKKVLTFNSGD